jgi:hypothetical protein
VVYDPKRDLFSDDPKRDPFAPIAAAERLVRLETLSLVSDAQLNTAFEAEGKGIFVEVPKNSALEIAIGHKLDAYYRLLESPIKGAEQSQQSYRHMLDMADFNQVQHAYFASPLQAAVALAAKGGGTIML